MNEQQTETARGRVVDLRESDAGQEIVLAVGDALRVLRAPPASARLGDIVAVELSGAAARSLVRLGGVAEGEWDPEGDPLRWRRPASATSRMQLLWKRQAVLRAVRDYLFAQGFLEVQTPLLVKGTCPDVHLTSVSADGGGLITSSEYQIKRMIAGGFERLFTLTQNFRAGDASDRHNPEFTMLEWARAFAPLEEIERDAEELTKRAFRAIHPGESTLSYNGRKVQVDGLAWERLTVREALARHLGMDVAPDFSLSSMRSEADRLGLDVPASFLDDRHALLSLLLDLIQPELGVARPTFLCDWPAFMTSSAALRDGAPSLAARSELFIAGLEISDGFPSLTDFALQRDLFAREQRRRREEGKADAALDERYLEALRLGLPPGAGMALGIDRLVMVITGAEAIRDVIAFAWNEL
jgi:elongation factor P--(R)-beta-lysine ligase